MRIYWSKINWTTVAVAAVVGCVVAGVVSTLAGVLGRIEVGTVDWTVVVAALIAGVAAGVPATIAALKTHHAVDRKLLPAVTETNIAINGRMTELITATAKAAVARAIIHERANVAHNILLRAELDAQTRLNIASDLAAGIIKESAAAAAAAAAAKSVP